ncbi:MAG: septum formation family protein [Cellulomonas iranensis]|uniref:septum formation family protein n=1 Tax=Cellulomonas iranensis TaxID=76862 RepID=UPI0013D3626A|nr:septum formation family protein [Cellulomonas iranensis]MBO9569137.1 septum formation family protein [Cellulomonas iranensis]
MTSRTFRSALAPLAVVALAVTLTGCGSILDAVTGDSAPEAQRDQPGGEITASADADVFSLQVGDCLNYLDSSDATEFSSLPATPCAEQHDAEIYAETKLTDEQYEAGDEFYTQYCEGEFAGFVGTEYLESALDYTLLYPTPESWSAGDDVLQCIVVHLDGGLTGTMRDSGL